MKIFLIAAFCAAATAHAQTTWKLATGYRAETFHGENIAQFGRDVTFATQGRLKIELAPNSSLFALNDIRQAVQDGKAQAGETIMTSLVKEMPIAGADSIPFVVGSYKSAHRLWQLQRPGMEREFAQRGLQILYTVPWPPQGLYVTFATQGRLKIELAPNSSLFALNDIRQAVQHGKAQAGETIMTSLVKEIPIAGADSIPFVVGSYKAAHRLWQLQRPGMEREFAQRGLQILYAVPWPPQGLYVTRPVKTVADFKGMKMRTYNQTTVRIAEMLGAESVDVSMGEVGRALGEGRLDTMITSAVTGVDNKVWGPIKYYYEINAWFPKNVVFVNAKDFNALPSNDRAQVLAAASAAENRGWLASEVVARESTLELQRNGIKVERLTPELEREIKRMGERFSREWVRSVGHEANAIFVPYYFN